MVRFETERELYAVTAHFVYIIHHSSLKIKTFFSAIVTNKLYKGKVGQIFIVL